VLAIKTTEELISFRRVAERINGKKILVLLDNCEHVLKSVPEIAERLMRTNSDIRILATSREPLSVTDECIYCVPPLDIPRTGDFSEDDMHASAVDLFLTRARAANPCYPMDPKTLQLTMAVCRHLDGIPLAIELAAARAAVFGIQVVAANMGDPFGVLADGCRTASPRQRTFRATLDWSYRTLNENERVVLRGVSIFKMPFTFHAACDAIGADRLDKKQFMDAFGGLVSKSLVVRDDDDWGVKYRLFEVIRAYAFEKLSHLAGIKEVYHEQANHCRADVE
jgi:predicted ATPase